jgi:hypothetical protein
MVAGARRGCTGGGARWGRRWREAEGATGEAAVE